MILRVLHFCACIESPHIVLLHTTTIQLEYQLITYLINQEKYGNGDSHNVQRANAIADDMASSTRTTTSSKRMQRRLAYGFLAT